MTVKTIRLAALLVVTLLFVLLPMRAKGDDPSLRVIELWPQGAPGATGTSDEDKPAIIPYLPAANQNTGTAILICPGGGFTNRATDHEGVLIAQWLKARGVAGFVLRYRIRPLYTPNDATADGQRAMRYIRSHAAEFHIAPDRIGMIGFSAGAELVSNAAYKAQAANPQAADPVERVSSQPNFQILAYGSSPMPAQAPSGDLTIPPTFLFCTAEDVGHLRGMVDLYAALRKANVPVESHFFVNGEHGVGFAAGDPVLGEWPNLMFNWMRSGGFLTGDKRMPVEGIVKLDGAPLPRGYVIFTPLNRSNNLNAPVVVAPVFNTGPVLGQFTVKQSQGLVPGRYRVEIRQDATRWQSNARDQMLIKMTQKSRAGQLTEEDRREWHEHARKRNLSPSIEGQRIYRRQRPKDKNELAVEIKAGVENRLQIDVFSR
jgi:acetyl esterase/lipase